MHTSLRAFLGLALLVLTFSLPAEPITLLDGANTLHFVDSAAPGVTVRSVPVTGVYELLAIDYRPATGELYGFAATCDACNSARVYRIDTTTGVATQISYTAFTRFLSPDAAMDFDPVDDVLRVFDGSYLRRIEPDTGDITNAVYAGGPAPPSALANSNNFNGATSTTLYGLNYANGNVGLLIIGSPGGTPSSPDDGGVSLLGVSAVPSYDPVTTGMDISPGGTAYATIGSPARLYTVNLTNGALTPRGVFASSTIRDLAVGGSAPAVDTASIPALSTPLLALLAGALAATAAVTLARSR